MYDDRLPAGCLGFRFGLQGRCIRVAVADADVLAGRLQCLVLVRCHERDVGVGLVVLMLMLDDQLDAMTDEVFEVKLVQLIGSEVAAHHLFEVFSQCRLLVERWRVATAPDAESTVVVLVHALGLEDQAELVFFAILCHALFRLRDVDQHGLDRAVGFWMRSEVAVSFFA